MIACSNCVLLLAAVRLTTCLTPCQLCQLCNQLDPCCRLHVVGCRHATSIDEDEQLLSDAGRLPPRLQAAVQARLERKRLLATVQQMLTLFAKKL
jgi:hypothetical protein